MKTKTLVIAAVMFLAISAAASAQSIFSTSSTPVTTVIKTGNAELTGDITFTGTGTSIPGTITIQYGGNNVNITSAFDDIDVTFNGATVAGLQVNENASNYSPGMLVIDIPAGLAPVAPATTYAITISGVRVQIDGTGLTSLAANISATGNLIAAGSTVVTVINSTTGDGIAANGVSAFLSGAPVDLDDDLDAPILNAVTGTFVRPSGGTTTTETIVVEEGFLAAFSTGVGVRISVSSTPPKGVSFTFPATVNSYDANGNVIKTWVRGTSTSRPTSSTDSSITSSSTSSSSLQRFYYAASDTGATVIEFLEIPVLVTSDPTVATFPYPARVFTATASLAPIRGPYEDDDDDADFGTPVGLLAPRFTALNVGSPTILSIAGSSTTLLIPYAYASTTPNDFNTAMAIVNTTEDPGTAVLGFTGAIPQAGPVTFYLFPAGAAATPRFSYTTQAGSPGSGLDASGNVVAGGTYSVFLSQIFPLAQPPAGSTATLGTSFTGYIMIVANFTNAHGIFVISNFTNLTAQSSLMPVLSDRTVVPEKW
jgi:hypothetical protein